MLLAVFRSPECLEWASFRLALTPPDPLPLIAATSIFPLHLSYKSKLKLAVTGESLTKDLAHLLRLGDHGKDPHRQGPSNRLIPWEACCYIGL